MRRNSTRSVTGGEREETSGRRKASILFSLRTFIRRALNRVAPRPSRDGGRRVNFREVVLREALSVVEATGGEQDLTLLEVGCMFKEDEGLSTLHLGNFCRDGRGGRSFYSIEFSQDHIDAARSLLRARAPELLEFVQFRQGHSLQRLPEVLGETGGVDFAFLDGGAHPEVCAHEFEIVLDSLAPGGIVLIDDLQELLPTSAYPPPRPFGKGTLILPFLVIGEYLRIREQFRGANHDLSPRSRWVEALAEDETWRSLASWEYQIITRGHHVMLAVGSGETLRALDAALASNPDARAAHRSPLPAGGANR